MQVSGNAWLLAAVAIPLTLATIAAWLIWVNRKIFALPTNMHLSFSKIRTYCLWPSILDKEETALRNLESGLFPGGGAAYESMNCPTSPRTLVESRRETLQTTAASMKI
jgi:hypothetical protein